MHSCTYGILGGTFDPPHISHLEIAKLVKSAALVDKVLLVPCFRHAFDKMPVSFSHRVEMCHIMAAAYDFVEVSDVEKNLEFPGRTYFMISALEKQFPGDSFRLVVGADIYLEQEKWYRFDLIVQKAPPIYLARKGVDLVKDDWLEAPPELSSGEIRERLRRGQPIDGLVCDSVLQYILENKLYGV